MEPQMVRTCNRKCLPIRHSLAAILLALVALPASAQPAAQTAPPPTPPPASQQATLPPMPVAPATAPAGDCGCGVPASPRGPR
jgi:hypothetical protein